jgi:hypothetical protein
MVERCRLHPMGVANDVGCGWKGRMLAADLIRLGRCAIGRPSALSLARAISAVAKGRFDMRLNPMKYFWA